MTIDEIKQLALYELGFEDDIDFTSTTDKAAIRMNALYEQVLTATLSRYRWGFAKSQDLMTSPAALTDNKYKYNYTLPSDFLTLRNQYSTPTSRVTVSDYDLRPEGFYTNQTTQVYIEYTARVVEASFPAYFIEYLKYKLAMDLCFNLTGDTDLLQILSSQEQMQWLNATNIDAKQRRTKKVSANPFVAVRGS